jgi:hypothetical protein
MKNYSELIELTLMLPDSPVDEVLLLLENFIPKLHIKKLSVG